SIILNLKSKLELINTRQFDTLENDYLKVLYKKNTPAMFKNSKGVLFMGIIFGISKNGNLLVKIADETVKEFGIKEISFV
ncbi:MAG: biotin--[acetyl-CoA-carboxylase] ligase, partial [Polaribacter sp.]